MATALSQSIDVMNPKQGTTTETTSSSSSSSPTVRSNASSSDLEILLFDAMQKILIPKIKEGRYRDAQTTLIICGETRPFRFLAKHLDIPWAAESPCVDLGCSTGEATHLLAKRGFSKVIGVDVSEENIAKATAERPEIEWRLMDVLAERDLLHEMIVNDFGGVTPVFFVDIGGDRMQETVVLFLSYVIQRYRPRLVVVKSRKLYKDVSKRYVEEDKKHLSVDGWNELVNRISEEELRDRKCFHPQRYPLRLVPGTDRAICRYFSYTGVCKKGDECEQDHEHCHHCQALGHRAQECEVLASELIVRKRH